MDPDADQDPVIFVSDLRGSEYFYFYFIFLFVLHSTLLHLPPLDSTVPTDAGIEPRTVATSALAVRHSNY